MNQIDDNGGSAIRTALLGPNSENLNKNGTKMLSSSIDRKSIILFRKNNENSKKKLQSAQNSYFKLFQEIWIQLIVFNKDKRFFEK
jgi:hypothetical protein